MRIYTNDKRIVKARNRKQAAMVLNCNIEKIKIYKHIKNQKMKTSTLVEIATYPAVGMGILIAAALFGLYKFGLHKDIVNFFTGKN
jgi:hypothetical protein